MVTILLLDDTYVYSPAIYNAHDDKNNLLYYNIDNYVWCGMAE